MRNLAGNTVIVVLAIVVVLAVIVINGCSAHRTVVEITKDSKGNIVTETYSERSSGFKAPTSITEWANAAQKARTPVEPQSTSANSSKPAYDKLGIIDNQQFGSRTVVIYEQGTGKEIYRTKLKSGENVEKYLSYGNYYTIWYNGTRKSNKFSFHVAPGKFVRYGGRDWGWFLVSKR